MVNVIKKIISSVLSFYIYRIYPKYIDIRVRLLSVRIQNYKNSHSGESCFIIGNGPSLKANDLDRIKIPSFSSNLIYLMLDEVREWTPYYYSVIDAGYVEKHLDQMYSAEKEKLFLVATDTSYKYIKNHLRDDKVITLRARHALDKGALPKFSYDLPREVSTLGTVTYVNIQLAVYMGFKKIYLLGVDNSYARTQNADGSITENKEMGGVSYFSDKYISHGTYIDNVDYMTKAYVSSKQHCDRVGVKIYNATRGGKLEVFPRVCFDDLFDDHGNFVG